MPTNIIAAELPKTRLSFVNVELVPVRTRSGEARYLCCTWGGAMHLFDGQGNEKVIPYPEGGLGSYGFTADQEDGFAWAIHTGGKITRINVDRGDVDFVQDVPLEGMNWKAQLSPGGYLVCTAHPASVMVYDIHRRKALHMIKPIVPVNTKGSAVLIANDGCVVIPMVNPGAELVRLDPQTGEHRVMLTLEDTAYTFPKASTFLPDGRLALPRPEAIETLTYPDFGKSDPIAYPETGDGWRTFRDCGDGRVYAWHGEGQPLYRLTAECEWEVALDHFSTLYRGRELTLFTTPPEGGLLALTHFGTLLKYDTAGNRSTIAHLNNLGHQRISALVPGEGDQIYTTTFINSSFQEMNIRTGAGRNITPCQASGGQVNNLLWFRDRLWLAAYGGAEINIYDPDSDGEWPDNPRPGVLIGEEQMRPLALKTDGKDIWCVTNARYGLLNGALTRIDPDTLTHKVWRGLVPESNPTSLVLHSGMAYVGTTIHRDQSAGPPGPGPGAVAAFDTRLEQTAWTARPDAGAESIKLIGVLDGALLAVSHTAGNRTLLRLSIDAGALLARAPLHFETRNRHWRLFIGGGRLCLAVEDGIFLYDFEEGKGDRIISGPVSPDPEPVTRSDDLFYIRGLEVALAEGVWARE